MDFGCILQVVGPPLAGVPSGDIRAGHKGPPTVQIPSRLSTIHAQLVLLFVERYVSMF